MTCSLLPAAGRQLSITHVRVLWVTKGLGGGAGTFGVSTHFRIYTVSVLVTGETGEVMLKFGHGRPTLRVVFKQVSNNFPSLVHPYKDRCGELVPARIKREAPSAKRAMTCIRYRWHVSNMSLVGKSSRRHDNILQENALSSSCSSSLSL